MAAVYCGLDAGSSLCQVVVLDESGAVVAERRFATSERNLIDAFAAIPGEKHVHLEASTLAEWIRGILKPRVTRVVVSHPAVNAWIARDPRKSDRRDAFKLADLLRRRAPIAEVYYADDASRAVFKHLVLHYEDLTDQETRLKFKLKARLRGQGLFPRGDEAYGPTTRERWLSQVRSEAEREALRQTYGILDEALKRRGEAKSLMWREGKRFPEVALLDGAPGVGPIGACQFVAYIQNPHRFSSKRKLWRYAKLAITSRSSDGKAIGRQRLDRTGCGRLKAMSHAAFLGATRRRDDNVFKRTYRSCLERTHNAVHARLTTQRKILAVLRAMWKGGTAYRDDQG